MYGVCKKQILNIILYCLFILIVINYIIIFFFLLLSKFPVNHTFVEILLIPALREKGQRITFVQLGWWLNIEITTCPVWITPTPSDIRHDHPKKWKTPRIMRIQERREKHNIHHSWSLRHFTLLQRIPLSAYLSSSLSLSPYLSLSLYLFCLCMCHLNKKQTTITNLSEDLRFLFHDDENGVCVCVFVQVIDNQSKISLSLLIICVFILHFSFFSFFLPPLRVLSCQGLHTGENPGKVMNVKKNFGVSFGRVNNGKAKGQIIIIE